MALGLDVGRQAAAHGRPGDGLPGRGGGSGRAVGFVGFGEKRDLRSRRRRHAPVGFAALARGRAGGVARMARLIVLAPCAAAVVDASAGAVFLLFSSFYICFFFFLLRVPSRPPPPPPPPPARAGGGPRPGGAGGAGAPVGFHIVFGVEG